MKTSLKCWIFLKKNYAKIKKKHKKKGNVNDDG